MEDAQAWTSLKLDECHKRSDLPSQTISISLKKKININIQVLHSMTKLNHPLFYGIDVLHHLLSEEKLIEKIKDDEESKSHTLT